MKLSMLGMLNGFLPCGMVYAALLNALLTGEIAGSALAMVFFGIGTLPSMIGVIYMANKITPKIRAKFNKVVPYLITMVGLLIVLRGLNLGIPFISPIIKIEQPKVENPNNDDSVMTMECCHSKKSCD
jgi:sulfite exporter TauE/SafE